MSKTIKALVIAPFLDKESFKGYRKGDFYEHEDADRIAFLVEKGFLAEKSKQPLEDDGEETNLNNQDSDDGESGPEQEKSFPKNTGGSWYELSNGEKIQGKDEAISAQAELEKSDQDAD